LLHSFPSNIEHCLQWARELLFEGEFVVNPEEVNTYMKSPDYLNTLTEMDKKKKLEILDAILINRQASLDECAVWARILFEEYYVRRPKQLIHTFPTDAKDNAGQPFWQGTRRPPTPTPFDPSNETHCNFIVATTFLRAYVLALIDSEFKPADFAEKKQQIMAAIANVKVDDWKPKDNVDIAYDPEKEKEKKPSSGGGGVSEEDEKNIKQILSKLPKQSDLPAGFKMNVLDFEKDDDENFHIDFIFAAANLRAVAYEIPTVSRLQARLIAGKIIPAIVTTTATVSGLVCLELFKLAQGKTKLEDYKNCFCNLAIPVFNMADAVAPTTYKYKGKTFTTWDSVKIKKGDITTKELIEILDKEHGVQVFTIQFPLKTGMKNIYMSFGGDFSRELETKVSVLVKELMAAEGMTLEGNCFKLFVTPDDDDDCMDMGGDDESQDQFPPVWFFF
jgi:ubiquitin-activating enzyme E1